MKVQETGTCNSVKNSCKKRKPNVFMKSSLLHSLVKLFSTVIKAVGRGRGGQEEMLEAARKTNSKSIRKQRGKVCLSYCH
jgi:hypothetical protein